MLGEVRILNVGAGDIKLTFNNKDPAETIRAARIVKDMLRRGFALLVEVERDGAKVYTRAEDFNEQTCEYIIADFDPVIAQDDVNEQPSTEEESVEAETTAEEPPPIKNGRRRGRRALPARGTRAVAVGRSAGG